MKPSRLIDTYLAMRSALTGQSATGFQLERLRLNLPGGGNLDSQEEQRAYFAHLAYAMSRLTADEYNVVTSLREPLTHTRWTDDGNPLCSFTENPVSKCVCGAIREYEREIRDGDLIIRERDGERFQETFAGERYSRPGHAPGFVVVQGVRPVYPTRKILAARLGMEFGVVKRLIRAAYAKLETAVEE